VPGGTPAEPRLSEFVLNEFIESSRLFDDVVDFHAVTAGGAGDHVHPNRAGYLSMGNAVNMGVLVHP
jgi:hypothetical protein